VYVLEYATRTGPTEQRERERETGFIRQVQYVQWQAAREGLRPSCWPPLTYKYHKTFAKSEQKYAE